MSIKSFFIILLGASTFSAYADFFEAAKLGCEDGAKIFAPMAFDTAQIAKKILQISSMDRRIKEVEKLKAEISANEDELYLRVKEMKAQKRKADPRNGDWWEIYYSYYELQAKSAYAHGVNDLDFSVVKFRREMESGCIKDALRK